MATEINSSNRFEEATGTQKANTVTLEEVRHVDTESDQLIFIRLVLDQEIKDFTAQVKYI